jgi:hypothetical protein
MKREMRMTIWVDPDKVIESEWGNVSYSKWMKLESSRRNKNKHFIRKKSGLIALFKKV